MRSPGLMSPTPLRIVSVIAATVLVTSLLSMVQVSPAVADTAPAAPTPSTVSTDPLPTPQINGVVWDQVIVGDTVYVSGDFSRARPFGSAPGANEVNRSYMLAYNLSTGTLLPWAPTFNAQVRALAASPDGTRLYVVGDFTQVNGTTRNRIVAFDTQTGNVIPSFTPGANYRVYAVTATNATVYFSGPFTSVSGNTRLGAAAALTANGSITGWAPELAGGRAYGVVISPDASKVVIGGDFTTVNGSNNPGYGLAMVDAAQGQLVTPFAANTKVRNAGTEAAIFALESDADSFYGSGYVFGSGGNLEGIFRANWSDSQIVWINDCHGDTYSVSASSSGAIYAAGHPHYCGNIDGFPQTDPWTFHRGIAFTKEATGVVSNDPYGYPNWVGNKSPSLLNFFPNINLGSFTGQFQGPWDVDSNDQYAVYGGEFTQVNGRAQQGLVRFAVPSIAPNLDGPRLTGDNFVPSMSSPASGVIALSWPANYDRDNEHLTYQIIRDGRTASPIFEKIESSRFYNQPTMTYLDTGLTPGQNYTYRLRAIDPFGNNGWGSTVSFSASGSGTLGQYARGVMNDQPTNYWRLGDSAGSTAIDSVGRANALARAGVGFGETGAIVGDSNTAADFTGATNSYTASSQRVWRDNTLSVEAWFKTNTLVGGKIVGFGSSQSNNSSNYDRHIYMDTLGRLNFGVYPGNTQIIRSASAYNDNAWHHVVGSLGPNGMELWVDGVRAGVNPNTTWGQNYWGYWRIGGDNTWSGARYFNGQIDEVAIYPQPLSGAQIQSHFTLSGRNTANVPPVAAFTHSADGVVASFDASTSSDSDGTISTYAWNFGDGSTGTGETTSHTYAEPGDYTVTLTVTDNDGWVGETTHQVTVSAANVLPTAEFTHTVTDNAVSFDASASADTDGTISTYAWDFGDASTGTGETPAHSYAAAGDYTVVLTVTDNSGGTATMSRVVTAGEPPAVTVLARDEFSRTVAAGWGTADAGGDWTTNSAGNTSVGSGVGVFTHGTAGSTRRAWLSDVSSNDVTVTGSMSIDKTITGGGAYTGLIARQVGSDFYQARVRYFAGGDVAFQLLQGGSTILEATTIPGMTYTPGEVMLVKVQAFGTSPTTIRGKLWKAGSPEPTDWTLSTTSSSAGLQFAGTVGTISYLSGSATNTPVTISYDSLLTTAGHDQEAGPTNLAPTAQFTNTITDTSVSFDASASSDPDGTISSYAWDFGDGSTGTGVTTSHVYAAGTYTVTLTVTDNEGGTATFSSPVTVSAVNVLPTAEFTHAVTDNAVAFDASASDDTDGTISTYTWDFGDASTGTGETPAHSYAAAGDYTVVLTVTDNSGGTATVTHVVTAGQPPAVTVLARDEFSRTVAAGWGTADAGGDWTTNSAGNSSVGAGVGVFAHNAGNARQGWLPAVSTNDVTVTGSMSIDKTITGGGAYTGLIARQVGNDFYQARVRYFAGGDMAFQLLQGGSTILEATTIPGMTYTPGEVVLVKVQAYGTSPTTIRGKLWKAGTPEPTGWTLTTTSTTAGLQFAGSVGTVTYLSGSATNTPVAINYDSFLAVAGHDQAAGPANIAPAAQFTNTLAGLTASFDSAGSSDPDGTIATHSWAFGDGATSTEASPSHSYAAADTYTVTLTVTDNQGATGTVSHPVTVTDSPANTPPVAAFTSATDQLNASFDASGSSDAEGAITAYAWNFGDGSPAGTGVTTSHDYAAAGNYTVTLTVTDAAGATANVNHLVEAAAPGGPPAPIAADDFERTVAAGWGTATTGGAWSSNVNSTYTVSGGSGAFLHSSPGAVRRALLGAVSVTDVEAQVEISSDKAAESGHVVVGIVGRQVGSEFYQGRARLQPGGVVGLQLLTGSSAVLANMTVPGLTYAPGDILILKLQVTGTNPTTIQAKLWRAGTTEPAAWQLSVTDATAALQSAGSIGFESYISSSSPNAPIVIRYDNFLARTPQ
ncbi:PKD domain-containing protein [Homoserinimonas sp. A520]